MKSEFIEKAWPCHIPERSLDDPLLLFNFTEIIEKIKNEDAWKKGEINFHYSGNLASIQVLEGAVNFKTENNTSLLKKGGLLTLHEQVEHTLTALEESVILLTIAVCPANLT